MIWLEIVIMTLIIIAVAFKFYNIGYNECMDDFNEVYDFTDKEKVEGEEKNEN